MKRLAPLTVVLFIAASSLFAGGCAGCRFCKSDLDGRATMIASWIAGDLKFTKEQRVKLDKIKNDIVAKMKPKIGEREKLHNDIVDLITKERITKDQVARLIERHEAGRRDMKPFITEKIVEFHAILTPEQKKKLAGRLEKMHKRCGLKK